MTGQRIYFESWEQFKFRAGDHGKDSDGVWWVKPPVGTMGILAGHAVTEHADGTITVSPSILLEGVWHGYLERGIWREA